MKEKKVFVAMSGGVDSSVSATLLKEAGYDVTGVFINVWQPDFVECSSGDDRREAMRVAAQLEIPFLTFDFSQEYKKEVVDYMIREYKAGRTPNPDVVCNQSIKFGFFLKKALGMGADSIATGHYARKTESRIKNQELRYALLAGEDKNKDQSYFLWTLTQEQLKYVLFPVGEYEKPKVRVRAREFNLPNAERKESQGLCFVGAFDMKEFLRHYIPERKGDVLNEEGKIIGYHSGAFYFTLGERHGFTTTVKTPKDLPYYVVGKDTAKNTLTVSHIKIASGKTGKEVWLEDVHFISGETPDMTKKYMARIRYRQPLQVCSIREDKKEITVIFETPQEAVTPGQSLVLYDGEMCLGGGIIS